MPITGLQLITVTATYLKLDGTPATGTVTFTPSTVIVNTAADEIVYPYPFTATLDGTGSFSIVLPATNDPDLTPVGWTYKVKENIVGSSVSREFDIEIPFNAAGATIDMADVAPVSVVNAVTPYVTLTGSQLITGTKTFQPSASNAAAIIIRGVSGQSAHLQEWQDDAGVPRVAIRSDGLIAARYFQSLITTGSYIETTAAGMFLISNGASNIPWTIRGSVGQTADLQQWQDSSGFNRLVVTSTGNLRFGTGRGELSSGGTGDPTIQILAGALHFNIRSIAGVDLVRVLDNGRVGINITNPGETLSVNGPIGIPMAGTVENNSAALCLGTSLGGSGALDDFLYQGTYLNYYGMGFRPNTGDINGPAAYISGYFGIDFFTQGVNAVHINRAGNVGIGTINPQTRLSIGTDGLSDSNVPVQIGAPVNGQKYFGANKMGTGHGVVFGYNNDTTGRTGGVVRVIQASEDLFLEVNNGATQLALRGAGTLDMNAVKLKWSDAGNLQTTVGGAGGASALPATPTKYLKVVDNTGTTLVIPAYAA